jgi:hypothetical protein
MEVRVNIALHHFHKIQQYHQMSYRLTELLLGRTLNPLCTMFLWLLLPRYVIKNYSLLTMLKYFEFYSFFRY